MKDDITQQESEDYWLSQGEAVMRDIMDERKDTHDQERTTDNNS